MSSYTNPNHGDELPGPSQPQPSGLDQTKAQVDEVVIIMKQNVDKGPFFRPLFFFTSILVLERDSKLNELDTRADALQQGAAQFETNANSLQRKFWWQNMKTNLIIVGVVVLIIVIIILVSVLPNKDSSGDDSS